jgi:hypothetical protein
MAQPEHERETSNASVSESMRIEDHASDTTEDEGGSKLELENYKVGGDSAKQENILQAPDGVQVTAVQTSASKAASEKDYSSFTAWEKRFIVFTATMGSFFSPFTAQIYFPALNNLAKDLHVTPSKINLTMTTYMACNPQPSLVPF